MYITVKNLQILYSFTHQKIEISNSVIKSINNNNLIGSKGDHVHTIKFPAARFSRNDFTNHAT